MKRILSVLVIIALFQSNSFSQYLIDNSTFENWVAGSGYENPIGWDSPNETTGTFMSYTVTKSTDAYEGSFSAQLKTTNIIINIPGVLVSGNFDLAIPSGDVTIDGGIPFTDRPLNFTGYYKYAPSGTDSCAIVLGLFKRNTITGNRDTVGYAQFYQSGTINEWTMFDVDIEYNSADAPDSLLVVISSSDPENPVSGSTLLVDGLEVSGGTLGVYRLFSENEIDLFPNPVEDFLTIKLPITTSGTIRIYDIIGKEVYKQKIDNKSKIKANISELPQGLYFVEIQNSRQKLTRKVFKK